jgi:translation initiation factor IF-2
MRISELAKELGYKAVELVALAQKKGLKVEDPRATINARMAAMVRAAVPHRSKLTDELLEVYARVQSEEAARAAAKAAAPKKKRAPANKKKAAPAAAKKAPPPPPKPAKKVRVVEEFRLGGGQKTAPLKPSAHKKVELSAEEQAEIRKEAAKPLIDVDKVIGAPRELHAMRPIEIEVYQRDKQIAEVKEKRHARPVTRTSQPVYPGTPRRPATPHRGPDQRRHKPRVPPAAMRSSVAPPKPRPAPKPMSERKIEVTVPISIKAFCEQAGIKVPHVMRKLIEQGAMVTINHMLDEDMVGVLASEFKRQVTVVKEKTVEEEVQAVAATKDAPKDLKPRPPVVAFMGHVDHGKTSLLDKIRNTDVVAGESGGITQHIGASRVSGKDGKTVVFLDTPGHEAFTQMRSRGASATDLAVIVVDAAEGVMPQTEEAINHARAANVKIVVALNKIDKPQANVNRVKGQLAAMGLQPEGWGGETVCVEVSALTGQGVDQLVEMLGLEAELLELKANPKRPATGVVLEARKTESRGVLATLLVQNGTLRKGDVILAGPGYGRVRAMLDDNGRQVDKAGPSIPVEVAGLNDVPDAGDSFQSVESLSKAKEVAEGRQSKAREATLQERQHISMENLFKRIESGGLKEVRVVIKADVKGSMEVLKEKLPRLSTDEVSLKLLHVGLGAVSEGDVLLADASDAIVIGFHVDVEPRAAEVAKDRGIEIRVYTVIYQVIDEMKAAMEGLLEPELVEVKQGQAAVREVFRISRVGAVAGCLVTNGKIERSNQIRLVRDGKVVHTGKLESLKRFKDDVKEVVGGYECGLKIAGHDDIRQGDVIEAVAIEKVARRLEKK